MAVTTDDTDYSKSTGAYPMPKDPQPIFVDNSDIDFSKSTGAYPMYDEGSIGTAPERVVEHIDAPADVQFTTPGPSSQGDPDVYAQQRQALGLSSDPSGDSDAGYEARPSSQLGAEPEPAETKVVEPPRKRGTRRTGGAEGK